MLWFSLIYHKKISDFQSYSHLVSELCLNFKNYMTSSYLAFWISWLAANHLSSQSKLKFFFLILLSHSFVSQLASLRTHVPTSPHTHAPKHTSRRPHPRPRVPVPLLDIPVAVILAAFASKPRRWRQKPRRGLTVTSKRPQNDRKVVLCWHAVRSPRFFSFSVNILSPYFIPSLPFTLTVKGLQQWNTP